MDEQSIKAFLSTKTPEQQLHLLVKAFADIAVGMGFETEDDVFNYLFDSNAIEELALATEEDGEEPEQED